MAGITQYLFSRSCAGTTHKDLIDSVHNLTGGAIYAKFFHMYPQRRVNLLSWLSNWLNRGCVAMVTLNMQMCVLPGYEIPDAWHHQMVHGVDHRGVYLVNPLQLVTSDVIQKQICSPSTLLVRSDDVRYHHLMAQLESLLPLATATDPRWAEMNVLGQVVDVLRGPLSATNSRSTRRHIEIPADYKSGVTLFCDSADSELLALLLGADQLSVQEHSPETR